MTRPYPLQQVTAVILAGGMGRRMGGRDKGLVEHRGLPLVHHLQQALAGQASSLLLSANRSHADYRALGFTPLSDLRKDYPGPLAGIEAAFAACDTDYLLVTPCDTPDIPEDMGPRLWEAMETEGAELAFACDEARDHYLHILLPCRLAGDLKAYLDRGGRAVRHWLADKRAARVKFAAGELCNINEEAELD